jgi:hypothetical protein
MRQLTLLLVGLTACVVGDGTAPDSAVITVRLRDEIGTNAGRNQVILTDPESTRVHTRTGIAGTVDVRVRGAGAYRIWVVPRVGYLASETLTREVRVAANEHVVVDFTLFRASDNPGFSRRE